ncbi:MAG: SufBD protein [Oscillospiraceae bacterium]|nr:SufBD protein [Oscillospiraceae bacterium]
MMEISGCIARLTDKDAKAACRYMEQIVRESREDGRWAPYFTGFAQLLRHKNSLVRSRAVCILAAGARWAGEEGLEAVMDELLLHIADEKPITARQCIAALPEIAAARPRLIPRIRQALESADPGVYRDSMRPLIERDIEAAIKAIV